MLWVAPLSVDMVTGGDHAVVHLRSGREVAVWESRVDVVEQLAPLYRPTMWIEDK